MQTRAVRHHKFKSGGYKQSASEKCRKTLELLYAELLH